MTSIQRLQLMRFNFVMLKEPSLGHFEWRFTKACTVGNIDRNCYCKMCYMGFMKGPC